MNCKFCNESCIKKGFQKNVQRLFCKACKKYQLVNYKNKIIDKKDQNSIVLCGLALPIEKTE